MMNTREDNQPSTVTNESDRSYVVDEIDGSTKDTVTTSPSNRDGTFSVRREPSFLVEFTGSFKEGAFEKGLESGREMAEWTKRNEGCQIYEIYKSMDPERDRTILVFIEWTSEIFFQRSLPERLQRYKENHTNCEKNSIHGMRWTKCYDIKPNPFIPPEIDLLTPEPLKVQDERGKAFFSCVALAIMAKAKPPQFDAYQLALARAQAAVLQRNDYGIIRFDIYVGAGDDNRGVNRIFAVFKTENDMESYLNDESMSLLSSASVEMLEMVPHAAKWLRVI